MEGSVGPTARPDPGDDTDEMEPAVAPRNPPLRFVMELAPQPRSG